MEGNRTVASPAKTGLETAQSEPPVIRMKKYSDHKKVVRYKATDPDAVIGDVYVAKTLQETMPNEIIVTVQPA